MLELILNISLFSSILCTLMLMYVLYSCSFITLHVHAQAGGYVIGAGVHLYIFFVYDPPKKFE